MNRLKIWNPKRDRKCPNLQLRTRKRGRQKQEQNRNKKLLKRLYSLLFTCDFLEISDTQGKQLILFPRIAEGIKVYYFPEGPVIKWSVLIPTKRNFCVCKIFSAGGFKTFLGKSLLVTVWRRKFAMLPAQKLLAGNSFIVRCPVTSK